MQCLRCFFLRKQDLTFHATCLLHEMSNWDTDLNKSDDCLLDPFCIYNIYAMFWFVFSVKNYTNKILHKLNVKFCILGK